MLLYINNEKGGLMDSPPDECSSATESSDFLDTTQTQSAKIVM